MPCRDDGPSDNGAYYRDKIESLEAMLCGVLTHATQEGTVNDLFEELDYVEMGVAKRKMMGWWENHQKVDAARKQQEKQERNRQAKKKQALEKLTPEERKILGL